MVDVCLGSLRRGRTDEDVDLEWSQVYEFATLKGVLSLLYINLAIALFNEFLFDFALQFTHS